MMAMTDKDDLTAAATATYAAAADAFDAVPFWDTFGRRTVARLDLRPGERVLDACCGTGASALPAAVEVGPGGRVLGLDLAEPLLQRARAKARAQGLTTVEFHTVDVADTGLPSASYDAVVCVFGIFFLPDMPAGLAELWRLVRPGGRLAVTVWGPRWVEPATELFWSAVRVERPDLVGGFHPWTRVTEPDALARLFVDAGVAGPAMEAEEGTHALTEPGDWWTIVCGTGYRATVEALGPEAAARVRAANLADIAERDIRAVETNVLYAVARKR
jgi:ubiquinone/menaquinone biosynthesis C-methylase UbiE